MTAAASLFDRLCAAPQDFDPATALRLARAEALSRGLPLRITARPVSGLAPIAVEQVWADAEAVHVSSHLFSYLGPLSPLPPGYTEIAAGQRRRRAGGMAAFLDLFTDRLTGLFVAAAGKYDLAALLRWARPEDNAILGVLRALIGFGDRAAKLPLPGQETLRFAGLLAQRTRSGEGLQAIAQAELGLPVRLEQFRLVWRDIPASERSCMGAGLQLGHNAMAGAQVPDRAGQCRLVIGPLHYADFLSLEPGQPRIERLIALARAYVPMGIDFDIQIVLDRRDIPETRLGGALPSRLGWNTWARVAPAKDDSRDAIIRPDRANGGTDATAA